MSQESTAGHGPSRGFWGMNDHLKRYFRGKGKGDSQARLEGRAHQKRMDQAFTRSGPLSKAPHNAALHSARRRTVYSSEAIRMIREEAAKGATLAELVRDYGISRSHLGRILRGLARK